MTGKRRSKHEGSIFKDQAKGLWTAEINVEGKKKRKTSKSQQVVREWLLLQRQAVKPHRWYPIYCIATGCGLREGEILGLRKQDVDLANSVLHVQQTVDYITGHSIIGTPKSESCRRSVAIPDFVLAVLQAHLQTVAAPEQLIFTTANGTPISHRNLLRHFHETLADLDIPRVKFHSLPIPLPRCS